MAADTLKEKMREFNAGKTGSVSVSGKDLAEAAAAAGDAGDADSGPTSGDVQADVPQEAKDDPLAAADKTGQLHQGMMLDAVSEKIDITEEDRSAFLDAIVSGGRYERDFSLFGGRLRGTFRCRLQEESDGILAYLTQLVNGRKISAQVEYLSVMRSALLAAQVKCLRGLVNEDFDELKAPYAPHTVFVERKNEKGETVKDLELSEPGWVGAVEVWSRKPEALATAVHSELQKFERRYWAMLKEAPNENFWNPAAST